MITFSPTWWSAVKDTYVHDYYAKRRDMAVANSISGEATLLPEGVELLKYRDSEIKRWEEASPVSKAAPPTALSESSLELSSSNPVARVVSRVGIFGRKQLDVNKAAVLQKMQEKPEPHSNQDTSPTPPAPKK
ncbi:MAG: hypothetical protein KIT56_08440 [Gammaproteobacteria bacterium]|nr:hypothetical protein [Gammaproteobacteria bacterium]